MGAVARLSWLCALIVFCSFVATHQVFAESKENSDLVFDNLEPTDQNNHENHHRIARNADIEEFEDSVSGEVEDDDQYWLTATVNRVRRSIDSFFGKKDEHPPKKVHPKKKHGNKKNNKSHKHKSHLVKRRKHRQTGEEDDYDDDEDENEDTINEEQLVGQEFDNGDDELDNHLGFDDEDNLEGASGFDGGSGLVPEDRATESTHAIYGHPRYYRFTYTLIEPFVEEFNDRNSNEFHNFASRIKREVEDLYRSLPGEQTATVISIQKDENDPFRVRVTVDIDSTGYYENAAIKEVIYSQIANNHRLGSITASPDNFNFRAFEEHPPKCGNDELTCRSGQCVPLHSRCNGIRECNDNSDEDGCESIPTTTTTTEHPTFAPDVGSGDGDDVFVDRDCRADDAVRCADGSRIICSAQICDGTKDCANGADEDNCTISKPKYECTQGEFGCDLLRCIPATKRCDGVLDCSDRTDEQECPTCKAWEIKCDHECIDASLACDGIQHCLDGTDERNCPEPQCSPSQFSCGDGECIQDTHVCDGHPDCRSGLDEANCTRPGKRCGDREFTCGTGACIPLEARCDRHYDCDDQSDERNCPCLPDDFHCDNGFCIPKSQRCDGTNHCQDRSDEIGCAPIRPCLSYEWKCDDGTCIDEIYRCNLKPDCPDKSDEIGCKECSSDQFRCGNGTCIALSKRCDGTSDCPNTEDEENCAYCNPNEFRCTNGECIDEHMRCDRNIDCSDHSDERDCNECVGRLRCEDGACVDGNRCDHIFDCADGSDERGCEFCSNFEFRCTDGTCIDDRFKCDGVRHCNDGSDEEGCVTHCPGGQFRCNDGLCLDHRMRCDGYTDCHDGSDELDCPPRNNSCGEDKFNCGSSCIDINFRCDGYEDCPDASDEVDCPLKCSDSEFSCDSDQKCIPNTAQCDGKQDCADGSDEVGCAPTATCRPNEFRCSDGACIPNYLVCNGRNECPDGSDEVNCPCRSDQFQCLNGRCIEKSLQCDRRDDCGDRSDEQNCPSLTEPPPISCPQGYHTCDSRQQCIRLDQVCDGRHDCHDKSDESRCPVCGPHEFRCSNTRCVDSVLRCNRRDECGDGSDEINCPPPAPEPTRPVPTPLSCAFGYRHCDSQTQCIREDQFCDGPLDCNDLSDESRCYGPSAGLQLKTYPSSQEIKENVYKPDREVVFQCRDEGPLRARVHWTRPGNQPLPPGSRDLNGRLEMPNIKVEHGGTYICAANDYGPNTPGGQVSVHLQVDKWEPPPTRPPIACAVSEATCANGECISKSNVCDGEYHCTDGSDETSCNPNGCEPNQFQCANKKCVLKTWRCDSDDDCGDGSDETNCEPAPPGSFCAYHQFACHSGNQCIPKSYHCDAERDCVDGSDEIGCTQPVISVSPPPMVTLEVGGTLEISCTAVGIPTPEVVWRLNWKHVPSSCRSVSVNGRGELICDNFQVEYQGAYSCEAINTKGSTFAIPDTIVSVTSHSVCREGYFNVEATTETECIKCFCFGHTSSCRSADLYVYQFQPPFDTLKLLGVRVDPYTGVVDVRDEPIYRGAQPELRPLGRNGVYAALPSYGELNQPDVVPYFALPANYHGNQLKSYGGYLRYTVRHSSRGHPILGPDVIITGNNYTLLHESTSPPTPNRAQDYDVRFFEGNWILKSANNPERHATREEIMMALEDVNNILIKLQYNEGSLNTTLSNIEMDSAATPNSGLGAASFVEQCSCPAGYTGYSCESCAEGYVRQKSGPWLGQCYREPPGCPPGYFHDGRECQICPCPGTNPSNQFARTCHLGYDGNVVCDCPAGYVGNRCEQCAPGYSGNPTVSGGSCRPESYCSSEGSLGQNENGTCRCKELTTGPTCNQCKANAFALSSKNQFGCIACFCMGVTRQCSSSNWYRDTISTAFTNSIGDFALVSDVNRQRPITTGLRLDQSNREIQFSSFASPDVYYWSLPSLYLGDKVTSYGGYLKYTLRHTPVPGGASSRNSAADVELVSANKINLLYFSRNQTLPTNTPQTFVVPLLEQYWQRSDGQPSDREHLLMALADLSAIYIKATYYTNTQEAAIISVSLDIANERNTGSLERALEVEQCVCPVGYTGLSCEDCDVGYTRSGDGIYLELCQPCNCNGHSNECDAETGDCFNCRDFTTGPNCEQCLPGYTGDPTNGIPCRYQGPSLPCNCDLRGSISSDCLNGICSCKANVEGQNCDRCRTGTFGLSVDNNDGCEFCFCSGVATECSESNLYVQQIPVQIIPNHGFTLTDQYHRTRITDGFEINTPLNEIGYNFLPSQQERLFWSLPREFIGKKLTSYGGKLEFIQRYTQRPHSQFLPDQDVIINGNGVTIYWTNPTELRENVANTVSVRLHPSAQWYRLDQEKGPKPASREDILIVLANIDSILIRATQSSDTASAFLSDISLDTAVDVPTGQLRATSVESCRCPPGYRGLSCESCAPGYYRDLYSDQTKPLGACTRCPCSDREESCYLAPDRRVICNCRPEYTGAYCESETGIPLPPPTTTLRPLPYLPLIDVQIAGDILEIYEIGSKVTLNCTAISKRTNRTARVHWRKEGGNLPVQAIDDGRGLLIITRVRVTDSGSYQCEADDGYSIVTKSIDIRVGHQYDRQPIVSVTPVRTEVYEGELIEVRCTSTGVPTPNYALRRTDGRALNPLHTFIDGLFRIIQAQRSDQGEYECIASNRAGSSVSRFEIFVSTSSFMTVTIEPESYFGRSGETVMLRCSASGVLQSVRWSREGADLPYNSRQDGHMLIINDARVEDSGIYVCTATAIDRTRGMKTVRVDIESGTSAGEYPTARVSPKNIVIAQGQSTELRCDTSGSPTPSVKWTKAGSELRSNVEQIGSVLYIRNAGVEDRGHYVCVATNIHGIEQDSATVDITRLEHPGVEIYPKETQIVTEGNSVDLYCRINAGIPTPTVQWSRADRRPFGPNVEEKSGGTLRIMQITQNDAGEYICSATNQAGTATGVANIIIHTRPEVFVMPSEDIIKTENESLIMECHGTGVPPPHVSWIKEGGAPSTDHFNQESTARNVAVKEFIHLTKFDEGTYYCRAQNDAGYTEKIVRLYVGVRGDNPGGDIPRPPSNPEVQSEEFVAPVGTRAEIQCRVSENKEGEDSSIYIDWQRENNATLPPTAYIQSGTLYIDNVQPSAAGDYYCTGIETYTGKPVIRIRAHLTVVALPHITLIPQRQTAHPGQNVVIECRASGEQPISISWYPINRTMPSTVYTREGLIRFERIHWNDAGLYGCKAVNVAGEANAVAEVIVESNHASPPITAVDHQVEARVGNNVTLRCRTPNSREIIRWIREHYPLPVNARETSDSLIIYNLQREDEGRYYCEISREGQIISDYIDLRVVSVEQKECNPDWWPCANRNCVLQSQVCDGKDDCGDHSDEAHCEDKFDTRPGLKSLPSPQPRLQISPREREFTLRENIEIVCQSNEPGVITTWSKLSDRLASNVQNSGGRLRIHNLRLDNAGIYRCEATGRQGVYYEDYNINVKDDRYQDEVPVDIKTAPRGSTVILECKSDLPPPTTYLWSKQGGSLPKYIDVYRKTIELTDVGSTDAGTYVCSTSDGSQTLDIPTILVVTGIVPYFTQAPNSYITLPTLGSSFFIQFSFEISFKPEKDHGLILYNSNKGNAPGTDFISLALDNAVPEFKINLGTTTTTLRAEEPITSREWHTVKIIRNRKKVTMYVDSKGPYTVEAEGRYIGLDLSEPLFLGGVPSYNNISPDVQIYEGFVGCISRFKVGHVHQDIMQEALNKTSITTCETCAENKCQNQGACQESLSKEGYICICPTGFSGPTCNKLKGEACSPHACGVGRCIDLDDGFECQCPLGRTGRRCEREITIMEPAFSNGAYMAYHPPPKPARRLKISLRFKPNDDKDALLLYCGETDEGDGDFISVGIKDKHLEFRFRAGNGPTVIRDNKQIVPGEWSALSASKSLTEGRLVVNGGVPAVTRLTGTHKAINLQTPLYIGGYDKHQINVNDGVAIYDGFNGCISNISVSGMELNILQDVTDASNIENCTPDEEDVDNDIFSSEYAHENQQGPRSYDSKKTGCLGNPCLNDGQCYPLSPVEYQCNCMPGFTGKHCETAHDLCESNPCQNGGECKSNGTSYTCDCHLGHSGANCDQRIELRNDAHFNGNGYLEFSRSLLSHENDDETEIIALEFSTNKSDGLIFWHGQPPNENGQGQDYISLAVVNGYLEYSFDLGMGPAIIENRHVKVDDGERHSAILKRSGRQGSIEIDHQYIADGKAYGFTNSMNCNGNIFLGGTPNVEFMTGGRFLHGFEGCIHGFELQQSKTLDLGVKTIGGLNVKPCSSFVDSYNSWNGGLVN